MMRRLSICMMFLILLSAGCGAQPTTTVAPVNTPTPPEKQVVSAIPTLPQQTRATTTRPQAPALSSPPLTSTPSPLKGPLVALNQISESLWVYDLGTRSGRRLTFPGSSVHGVQWSQDGCYLYTALVNYADSIVTIVQTDLRGTVRQTILKMPRRDPGNRDVYRSRWSLSPTGEWAGFISYSGQQYYAGSEFQDIVLIRIDSPSEPMTLTLHRGGLDYAWSPDGTRIAYSDYDDAGVHQLYASDVETRQRIQVTQFAERSTGETAEQPGNHVGRPTWSPDGRSVAVYEYVVDAQNVVTGSIQVISANSGKQAKVASVNQAYVPWLAWSEDSATLAFYARPRNGHASVQETINWVDVNTGKVQHTLTSAEIPAGWISSVFSFRGVEQLGITDFFPGNSSYSYNYPMKEIEAFALPDLLENPDFIEVIAAPASFSGEEVCESKPR